MEQEEEPEYEKRRDSNDNIIKSEDEDDQFYSGPSKYDGDKANNSSKEAEKESLSENSQRVSEKRGRRRRNGKKKEEKHTNILHEVMNEFSGSDASQLSSDPSEPIIHRRRMAKNLISNAPDPGVRESDKRLEIKYKELQELLQDQFVQQQRILSRQQISLSKEIMRKYKLKSEGYVGHLHGGQPSEHSLDNHSTSAHIRLSSGSRTGRRRGGKRNISTPQNETFTQTGIQGESRTHHIGLSKSPTRSRKVTFREKQPFRDNTNGDGVIVVSCTRSPPKKHGGRSSRLASSASLDTSVRRGRSLSSERSDQEDSYHSVSEPDTSPTRPMDHHLKNSDNPKLLEWLKRKNKIHRKVRAKERKEERQKAKEKQREENEKLEKKKESEKKVKEWLKMKRRERSKSREHNKQKNTNLSKSEDEENVQYLVGGGKIIIESKKGSTDVESDVDHEAEKGSSNAVEEEAGEKESDTDEAKEQPPSRGRRRKRLKMAQKIISSNGIPEKKASKGMNGYVSLNRNKLPVPQIRKSRKSPGKNAKSGDNKLQNKDLVDEEKQKRFSYDAWLKEKRRKEKEKKVQERKNKEEKNANTDPTLSEIVSHVAQNRMKHIRGRKKRIETGFPDIDLTANKDLSSSNDPSIVKLVDAEQSQAENSNGNMYSLEGDNVQNRKIKKYKTRPKSAKHRFRTLQPQKSESVPQKSNSAQSNSESESPLVPSPPDTNRSFPPRPPLKSKAYKKVKRESKSWEDFADHVWQKLNSDIDVPEISDNKLSTGKEPPSNTTETIVVDVPQTEFGDKSNEKTEQETDDEHVEENTGVNSDSSSFEHAGAFFLTENSASELPQASSSSDEIDNPLQNGEKDVVESEVTDNDRERDENAAKEEPDSQSEEIQPPNADDSQESSSDKETTKERRKSVTFSEVTEEFPRTPSSTDSRGTPEELYDADFAMVCDDEIDEDIRFFDTLERDENEESHEHELAGEERDIEKVKN